MELKVKVIGYVLLAMGCLGLATAWAATITGYLVLPNTGTVTTVGVNVYWDIAKTSVCTGIDWAFMDPGASATKTIYVYNSGDHNETLSMTVNGWNPTIAGSYITVSWNRQGTILPTNAIISANITLAISPSVAGVTNFNFNITITGVKA